MTTRRTLVEANVQPSMRRQCELLGVNRSSLYYEPVVPDAEELALMRRMDELHLKRPFFGSRAMAQTLKGEGLIVNRKVTDQRRGLHSGAAVWQPDVGGVRDHCAAATA